MFAWATFAWLLPWAAAGQTPSEPMFIRITPKANEDVEGLADVLIGALGLTGALMLTALVLGLAVGGLIFWLRSRES
jgi:hypothetical protein